MGAACAHACSRHVSRTIPEGTQPDAHRLLTTNIPRLQMQVYALMVLHPALVFALVAAHKALVRAEEHNKELA